MARQPQPLPPASTAFSSVRSRGPAAGVTLTLQGVRANRDGAGAVVRAGAQTVYAGSSGSYLSASDRRVHLAGSPASVEITWPGGRRQTEKLAPGPLATVKEKE